MALLDLLGGARKLLITHNGPVLRHAPVQSSPETTALQNYTEEKIFALVYAAFARKTSPTTAADSAALSKQQGNRKEVHCGRQTTKAL